MPVRPAQHRPKWWKPYKEDAKQAQRRQGRRALPTNSAAWRRIREAHLSGEPLCRECSARGLVVAATDVDHVDGDDGNNAPGNLQSLCHGCHSRKTAMENGGFGRARRQEGELFDGILFDAGGEAERDRQPERIGLNLNGSGRIDREGEGQSLSRSPSDPRGPLPSRFHRI